MAPLKRYTSSRNTRTYTLTHDTYVRAHTYTRAQGERERRTTRTRGEESEPAGGAGQLVED
jgi:hypothetical protein